MWKIIEELGAFFDSELSKSAKITFVVIDIFIVILAVIVTALIFNKLIIPFKLGRAADIEAKYQEVLKENEELKGKMRECKITEEMLNAVKEKEAGMAEDKALSNFLIKKK